MRRALVVIVIAACDSRVHHGLDAGTIDAPGDTLSPVSGDPPANATKLTITRGGMPVIGAAVFFQNADAAEVSSVLTNDQGLAWAVMPGNGGFVTALERIGNGIDELSTFSQVQQSESLALELAPTGARDEYLLSITANGDGGANAHLLYTSCGGPYAITPGTFTDLQLVGCAGVADMVVMSLDGEGAPLNSAYLPSVTLPTQPPPTDAITYPGLSLIVGYAALATTTFSYTNVPASVNWVATYHALANANGRTYEQSAGVEPSGATANLSIPMPVANVPTLTVTTGYSPSDLSQQMVYEERPAMSAPYALDLGGTMLPSYTLAPAYDVASSTVTWTERSTGVVVDVVRTRLHVYRDDIPAGRAWRWRMIGPRSGTAFAYPRLPIHGFDFNPASGDTVMVDELTTVSVPGGYAAVRANGFGDYTRTITSTGGRMVVQLLSTSML